MSTRTVVILAALIVIIALGGFWYLFTMSNQPSGNESPRSSGGGGLFDFLNFGGNDFVDAVDNEQNDSETSFPNGVQGGDTTSKLRVLVKNPVSAAISTTTANGFSARYIDRATGHLRDVKVDTGENIVVSNTTIPGIQTAYMLPGGEAFVVRFFDESYETAETFGAKLVKNVNSATSSAPYASDGNFFDRDIEDITPSPSSLKVAYIAEGSDNSAIYTADTEGLNSKLLMTHPVKEWSIQWPVASTITLTSKPSAGLPGYAYFLPASGGTLSKVVGGILGLTTLTSPSANMVLLSGSGSNTFGTKVYDTDTKTMRDFPVTTLPEKCVWSKKIAGLLYCAVPTSIPPALYPDAWYQGTVSFSDTLWEVDSTQGVATLLSTPNTVTPGGIDAISLSLDKDESLLTFINKKDGSLWALDLRE